MHKVLSAVFGSLFVLFAAFQYNDPDPELWVPIYGFAAMACLMAYVGLARWWFLAAMAALYVVAAVYQWPPVFEGFLFREIGMRSMNIERAREAGGLAICAAVLLILAILSRRSRPIRS